MFIKKGAIVSKMEEDLNLKKKKRNHENPGKKRQAVKMRYDDKKESVKQYIKEKYVKN